MKCSKLGEMGAGKTREGKMGLTLFDMPSVMEAATDQAKCVLVSSNS